MAQNSPNRKNPIAEKNAESLGLPESLDIFLKESADALKTASLRLLEMPAPNSDVLIIDEQHGEKWMF